MDHRDDTGGAFLFDVSHRGQTLGHQYPFLDERDKNLDHNENPKDVHEVAHSSSFLNKG